MDERTYRLVVGIVILTGLVVVVGGLAKFAVNPGFYVVMGSIIGLLTAIANRRDRG